MLGRATIRLGIGPHSSFMYKFLPVANNKRRVVEDSFFFARLIGTI